ncbi:hypothetical protein ACM66B_003361 [Microbotryomycetes sp. NB124-2]
MLRRQSQKPGADHASPLLSPALGRAHEHGVAGEHSSAVVNAQASSSSFSPRTLHTSQFEPSTVPEHDEDAAAARKQSVHWAPSSHRRRSTATHNQPIHHDSRTNQALRRRSSIVDPMLGHSRKRARGCTLLVVLCVASVGLLWVVVKHVVEPSSSSKPSQKCPHPMHRRHKTALRHCPTFNDNPVSVPSSSRLFVIEMRADHSRCNSFELSFSRRDKGVCRRAMDVKTSRNKALDQHIKNTVGPDTILLQIDGAERLAVDTPTNYDSDACTYTFQVHLNNPGLFWVNMTLTHQDFDGTREVDASPQSRPQPRLLMTPLVKEPVAFDICSSICQPFVPSLVNDNDALVQAQAVIPVKPSLAKSPQLKPCTAQSQFTGSYVPSNLISILYPRLPVPFSVKGRASSTRSTTGFYTFVPDFCAWSHSGLRFSDRRDKCVDAKKRDQGGKGHRALVLGDSHGRTVFDVALQRLKGERAVVTKSPKGSKHETVGDVYMEYVWDPYLKTKPSCDRFADFDSITFSFGTHHLRQDCAHTTTYLAHLFSILHEWPNVLKSCPQAKNKLPRLIIMTIPPMHPQLHNHDCRTNPRISLWNKLLKQLVHPASFSAQAQPFQQLSVDALLFNSTATTTTTSGRGASEDWFVVDFESLSKPVSIDTDLIDGVHYLMTDAIEVVVDDWIGRSGLCP